MPASSRASASSASKSPTTTRSIAKPDTVTLDFTSAAASLEHLEVAAKAGAAIVIGSTGFTPEMEKRARELAQKTRTVIAPNMSIGRERADEDRRRGRRDSTDFDAEVIEIHHRTKVDAPSGTALSLGRAIAPARGAKFADEAVFGREGITGVRPTARSRCSRFARATRSAIIR